MEVRLPKEKESKEAKKKKREKTERWMDRKTRLLRRQIYKHAERKEQQVDEDSSA